MCFYTKDKLTVGDTIADIIPELSLLQPAMNLPKN